MGQPSTFEQIVAALRLDRSRRRWRFFAIVLLIILLFAGIGKNQQTQFTGSYVAYVPVEGLITSTKRAHDTFNAIADDKHAKALVVHIDSPGGTMVGGMELYDHLRHVARAEKPVVVIMGTVAASAGYLAALGGDHILANPTTLTGSVGVIMPLVDARGLADTVGIKSEEVTSGDKKVITSPLYQRSPQDRQLLQQTVNSLQDVFVATIEDRRKIDPAHMAKITDGRVVTGQQAQAWNMIDGLGGLRHARSWLEKNFDIGQNMAMVEMSLTEHPGWLGNLMGGSGLLTDLLPPTPGKYGAMSVMP